MEDQTKPSGLVGLRVASFESRRSAEMARLIANNGGNGIDLWDNSNHVNILGNDIIKNGFDAYRSLATSHRNVSALRTALAPFTDGRDTTSAAPSKKTSSPQVATTNRQPLPPRI